MINTIIQLNTRINVEVSINYQFKIYYLVCHYTCATCDGDSSEDCLTCLEEDNRILNSSDECECLPSTFELEDNSVC